MSQLHFKHATVIGSGPNGLAAAIKLAQNGIFVRVLEAQETVGGGTRSAELTLPGFVHDICSAVHPLGVASPFFSTLPLASHGLEWIQPPASLAHPLDDGTAVMLERSIDETVETIDKSDVKAYRGLMKPFVENWEAIVSDLLAPIGLPHHPLTAARFGFYGLRSANGLAKSIFQGPRSRALFGGICGHSMLSLDQKASASFGLMLAVMGHAVGWAIPRGGSQKIADALVSYLRSLGGEVVANRRVESIDDLLSPTSAVLCDLTPHGLLKIARHKLSRGYQIKLENFRKGNGVFKIDWALNSPIPWKAKEAMRAGTVHLGGTLEEIAESEDAPSNGRHAEKPYVLVTQPSLFDSTRAPAGKHTAWGYCHVPNGSDFDMTERIENQIERFAPGFRDCIIAKKISPPAELERHNANLVGGNISGGSQDIGQLFLRPTLRLYSTPTKGLYLCSSSTPPGGGVHGMCGFYAAQAALKAAG
ncbi:MAG TPA: NAD(P)/FAD-dependent oxidoreductase [Pyrinomonadaceae bacterium]|jgi:phytoene dehydrogenase-like protein